MAPTTVTMYANDVLFMSLLYWVIDMQDELQEFRGCRWPLRAWLLGSYVFVIGCRIMHIVGARATAKDSDDFLLSLRHTHAIPRFLAGSMWLIVLPCFATWTVVGSFWIADSKMRSSNCLPPSETLWFVLAWHMLCYACIIWHGCAGFVASIREKRLRHAEADLREIENDDMRSRWGQVSQLSGYASLPGNYGSHLTPTDICAMPAKLASDVDLDEDSECSICLEEFAAADKVRELGACGHIFHCSCIDLWLLRCAHCPLCKGDVKALVK
jgi:hypothetical protein